MEYVTATGDVESRLFDDIQENPSLIERIVKSLADNGTSGAIYIQILSGMGQKDASLYKSLLDSCIDNLYHNSNTGACLIIHCYEVSRNLSLARTAPKTSSPNNDPNPQNEPLKDEFYTEAKLHLDQAQKLLNSNQNLPPHAADLVTDAKAIFFLARGNADAASTVFKDILNKRPNHTVALLGQARLQFARKQFRQALKSYQSLLTSNPKLLPDPRIGIGLCCWNLGDKEMAAKAWNRSIKVHGVEKSYGALIFLGLLHANKARITSLSDEERDKEFRIATNIFQKVYKVRFNSSAALGIARYLEDNKMWDKMYKISEKAIRYADSRPILADSWLSLARAAHGSGNMAQARKFYNQASTVNPDQQLSSQLALAQCCVTDNEWYPAANAYEPILSRHPKCIEAMAGLATVRAHLYFSSSGGNNNNNSQENEKAAMKHYEDLLYELESEPSTRRKQALVKNPDIYIDIARLWSGKDPNRSFKAWQECRNLKEQAGKPIDPQILNNLGCLEHRRGNYDNAQQLFSSALDTIRELESSQGKSADSVGYTTIAYNLASVYEDNGDREKAVNAYETMVLSNHPEWVEAKAKLASLLVRQHENDRGHNLYKEALISQPSNLELRALYSYYLYRTHPQKVTRDFTLETLRQYGRHDVYALCASGTLYYSQTRENKDKGQDAAKDRANKYLRAAEFFEKAIQLDPNCAYAAQGLGICLAEGNLSGKLGATHDAATTAKNAADALSIFAKVREAVNNAGIYICIGHCHFARDDYDRAIEAYETALKRSYNSTYQLYLARAWYHKGLSIKSYSCLRKALELVREAKNANESDVTLQFNLALIQQSCLDVQFDLNPSQRSLADLIAAREEATEALQTFETLGKADSSKPVPYNIDIAYQRSGFGRSRLKRAEDIIAMQEDYEASEQAKIDQLKKEREQAQQEKAAAEAARLEEYRIRAEQLAEQRRQMKEDVSSWFVKEESENESVDEDGKRKQQKPSKGKKSKSNGKSEGDNFVVEDDDEGGGDGGYVSDEASASGGEKPATAEKEKPRKLKKKRKSISGKGKADRKVNENYDEGDSAAPTTGAEEKSDDEGVVSRPSKRKKAFKSAEFIDSDEDM